MLKLNRIMAGLLAVVFLTVIVRAQEEDYSDLTKRSYGSKLDIKVWVDKGEGAGYEPGEDIRVYFKTNRDAYVIIYDIDTRGNVHLLYPYDFRDSRFVEGNRPYRIPSLRDDYYLKVNGPEGTEKIVALATGELFYLPDLGWDLDPDDLREEDYYYMSKPEGEDDWDFIERLNHRIVPDEIDYELDVASIRVEARYPSRYYTEPSFYFSYRSYPYWYSPDVYFGAVYFDYPFRAAIYIDGIFFGYTPYYLPYFLYGRHYVTIYNQGYLVYRDYCYVRPHYRNTFFVPRDRIYKNYTQRYAKDYRIIRNKPEIFWTKVRDLNTKYKATPVIKDDFNLRKAEKDISRQTDKFKTAETSLPKISKEQRFREKSEANRGDRLTRLENNKEKLSKTPLAQTPEKRLRKEKESVTIEQERFSNQESKEKTFRKEQQRSRSEEPSQFKEAKRQRTDTQTGRIERPKSTDRVKQIPQRSSGKESGFKSSTRSTPSQSGKVDRGGQKSRK